MFDSKFAHVHLSRQLFSTQVSSSAAGRLLSRQMSHTEPAQGTCERCGVPNRVLCSHEPSHDCCNVCALLARLQQMSSRLASESNFRYVCLYQDLQDAAQRFWTIPQGMDPFTAQHFAPLAFPTLVELTYVVLGVVPILPPGEHPVLPSIIPRPPEFTSEVDPNLGCPHTTAVAAPTITVSTPTYNRFSPGTSADTKDMAYICIPTDWQVTPRPSPDTAAMTPLHTPPLGSPCQLIIRAQLLPPTRAWLASSQCVRATLQIVPNVALARCATSV